MREEDSRYSKENITVAAFNDEVLGAIVMIPYEDLDKLTIRTDFRVINCVEGLRDKLYFLMKRVNYIRFRECKKGDLYVSNIATSSRARGLGIGKALMRYAEQTAKKEEYNGVSLLAKNEQVSKFYEKLDYKKIYDKITFGERIIKMAKFV
ncbi:GNAT family N-acetyltransferase [Clostridium intestinale]|uniref:GNAT family N-acetyltransferase n=1 Tax=Clostridium intestinale TaxID=36845 RepID=UPI0028E86C06|nr:GNAT family N-acetyltransferase [Clostridium intestinale]